jgi:hypothetical protein
MLKLSIWYAAFQGVLTITHLLIISIVAFFHFLLDHKFNLIEDWIYRNGWEVVVTSKLIAFGFMLKLLEIKFPEDYHFKKFLKKSFHGVKSATVVFVVFTLGYFYFLGHPIVNDIVNLNLSFTGLSYLGILFFYGIDVLLICYLRKIYPMEKRTHKLINYVLCAGMFYWAGKILAPFNRGFDLFVVFHFINCLLLLEVFEHEWFNAIMYIIALVCPLGCFVGLDPVWGTSFSFFKFSQNFGWVNILVLWLLSVVYLIRSRELVVKKKANA